MKKWMYMTLQQKLIALTVHLDQGFAEVLESSLFDDDAVDAGAIFTARKDFTLNDEFIVCVNFFRGKNLLRFGIVRNIESRFDCRFIGSWRIIAGRVFPPTTTRKAPIRTDLPAPVSPVMAEKPVPNWTWVSSMRAKLRIVSCSSISPVLN